MTAPASRRAFLFAAAAARFPQLIKASGLADEAYWEMVRAHFAFSEQRTPMNAANLCPAPRMVSERVVDLTLDMDRDCSFQNREKFTRTLDHKWFMGPREVGILYVKKERMREIWPSCVAPGWAMMWSRT
jgi:hypothetical protein